MTIASTSCLYDYADHATLTWHPLYHHGFREFGLKLDGLTHALGEDAGTDYWQPVLRWLRRYRFDLCAAPLPFNYQNQDAASTVQRIEHHLIHCEDMYHPSYAYAAREAVSAYARLVDAADNPMLNALAELGQGKSRRPYALLLKESRLIPLVERELAAHQLHTTIEPITLSQARSGVSQASLAVAGPVSWFPDDVFSCPRAAEIVVLYYGWIRTSWQPSAALVGSMASRRKTSPPLLHPPMIEPESGQDDTEISPEQLLVPLHYVLPEYHPRQGAHDVDDIDAHLVLLQGNMGVYLDTQDDATVLALDLEEDGSNQLRRMSAGQIEPGMFVLLRTSGGGDYIVPVADIILGSQSAHARACQELWKSRLREVVREQGLLGASIALLDCGSERANECNTRNWMSPRSIRTEDPVDFRAIMRLCGIEDRASELWDVMGMINKAHRKAGFVIRKQLLQQVSSCNLQVLMRSGRMDFSLPGMETGSLTAYRVEEVAQTLVQLAAVRAGHPFRLDVG